MLYRKVFAMLIFAACLRLPVFLTGADDESTLPPDSPAGKGRESVLAFGFEYGNFWGRYSEGTQNIKTHRASPLANVHYYAIRDGNTVGFFMHGDLLIFSTRDTVHYSGLQYGCTLGPVFRHELNEKLALFYGVGPNFLIAWENYTQYTPLTSAEESFTKSNFDMGIGINIMLRHTITNDLVLFAGCILTLDLLSSSGVEAKPSNPALNTSGSLKDFSMFGIRPYVSVGFRL
jgi:hypothetical protein